MIFVVIMYNYLFSFRRLDCAGSTDSREVYDRMFVENSNFCNSDQVQEATTVFNGVTSTTDLNKERKGSTPPLTSTPSLTSTFTSARPKNKDR